jgi:nitroreductase
MAVCPEGAIRISGRTLTDEDLFELPPKSDAADYNLLVTLLRRRRSIREFREEPVSPGLIDQVLEAAKTAPMGLPPSDVNVLVFDTREKANAFARDFCDYLEKLKYLISPWFLAIMRPFWGKANHEMFRDFLKPCIEIYTSMMKKGINVVTYDAPVALYFYGSPYCDPADPIVAATYAMIAAESLGLGTCMLGAIHPMIQSGGNARKFRDRHGIRFKSREGVFVIMGHPRVKFRYGIKRTFASVVYN